MKPLKERKQEFKEKLQRWIAENDPGHQINPKWLCNEFYSYWTLTNDGGRKMFYEMEKTWNLGGRLRTCRERVFPKDPRWKLQPKKETYKPRQTKQGQIAGFESLYSKESFNGNR